MVELDHDKHYDVMVEYGQTKLNLCLTIFFTLLGLVGITFIIPQLYGPGDLLDSELHILIAHILVFIITIVAGISAYGEAQSYTALKWKVKKDRGELN